jgi:putative transposase
MKLTIQLQLLPSVEQAALLLSTMERFNEAASFAAQIGFGAGVFSQPSIHKLAYRLIRERYGLSAQLAVRSIGKAVECFANDKTVCHVFKPHGAVTYDQRNLSFKGLDRVSLATLTGREIISLVYGEYQRERFDRIKGQCDLVYRDGKFFLLATVELTEAPPLQVKAFLGVDLGIVQIATTSEGESFSGAATDRTRRRCATARKQYQRKGTKNAKRRLKKLSGRQARFQRHVNHVIAKKIVGRAKALGSGIALENLKGIRVRVETTVGKSFRRRFGNWSFSQLRHFVEYKARLAGVPVVFIDPRNTSRTCSQCGHCEKANRKSQSEFVCKHCGFSSNADWNAATNIGRLGESKLASKVVLAESSIH